MQVRRFLLSGLVVPVAAALAMGSAEAQVIKSSWNGPGTGAFAAPWTEVSPVAFEGYYTHYRLDAGGDDRFGIDGVGARLLWKRMSRDSLPFTSRFGLGIFGEYAPSNDLGFSLLHAGLQGDVTLVSQPWFGRLMPIASLGAGVLHASIDEVNQTPWAVLSPVPLGKRSMTTFTLTPAAGLKLALWREFGLRTDARDLVTFRDGTHHNWQLTAGLSFPF
jgi:hypothetical protein